MTLSNRIKIPQGFWAGVREIGVSAEAIIRHAQLPLHILDDREGVTAPQYFAIWQAYSDLVGDISNSVMKLSTAFDTAHYPPSVLATYHARNYRDAINRMAVYKRMCPPESLSITEAGTSCSIELNWQDPAQAGPAVLAGITLATLLELGRRGTGLPIKAKLVEFSYPMGNVKTLEAYFGCRIRTDAKRNRLTLYRSDLDRPFLSYNEELLEILTPALDRTLDEQHSSCTIMETVKWIIKQNLAGGLIDMQSVARDLNISERTLQRRLTAEGTSFKQVLSEARHELALNYLTNPLLDMKEIAFLVGYEDQNSFYRSFRAWEGETPSNWRMKQHANPSDLLAR